MESKFAGVRWVYRLYRHREKLCKRLPTCWTRNLPLPVAAVPAAHWRRISESVAEPQRSERRDMWTFLRQDNPLLQTHLMKRQAFSRPALAWVRRPALHARSKRRCRMTSPHGCGSDHNTVEIYLERFRLSATGRHGYGSIPGSVSGRATSSLHILAIGYAQ